MNRLKAFLAGISGVMVGITIVSVIRDGEIDWNSIGILITMVILIQLFILGLNLYKK